MKKATALILSAIMALALAACSPAADQAPASQAPSQAQEPASAAPETPSAPETPASQEPSQAELDQAAADHVAELIDAIYVQTRDGDTDRLCAEAKAAWDALTDEQKELVEGEEADPDYFGRDTGSAALDNPLNGDNIGKNELLVVSFGTSFNDSRAEDMDTLSELLGKSELFSDFKAVQDGNVWCTGKYLFQATDVLGGMIGDIHTILTGADESDLTFIHKLK